MLRPFLILGVGGSGGKTIRGLRHSLTLKLEQAGWRRGIPEAWQMIHIDTPVVQDGTDYVMPFIPPEDYKGLVAGGASYEGVFASIVHSQRISGETARDAERMLPDPGRVPVDVTKGAGQFRAVGRAVALSKLADIEKLAQNAINRMSDASALGQLASLGERLGAKSDGGRGANPTVIVVSSIAGGSGAGQYLDVIEAVKSGIRNLPWAHQFFSLLYAPDVFDQITGSAGIPSNALATVSETMNGFWTQNPSSATIELFRSRGLSPAYGGARDRVGAAYPFIVGRSNSQIAFDNQGEVYSAVSASVAAWMTDDKVQGDIDEYATGNWTANVGADVLPDATRLMRPLDQAPPFSALGFGRVTLGREKFLDYATERFARAVIDRVLYAHVEDDPQFKERTEEEWIERRKTQAFESFLAEARLDEEGEERNDVIDTLRPVARREALSTQLRQAVMDDCFQNLDKNGGADLSTWHNRLLTAREARIPSYLTQETANLAETLGQWISTQPAHLIDTVELAMARHGLPVTIELLRDLSRVLKSAADGLLTESETHRGWIARLAGYVNEELSVAANQESIRPDQDAVEGALNRIQDSFEWEAEANLREVTSRLLAELRSDFVEPLRAYLEGARSALLARVTDRRTPDGRDNDYEFWPRRVDPSVPRKYTPAPNERLLVSHTSYPAEFDRLVQHSFGNGKFEDAVLQAVTELVRGPMSGDDISEDDQWSTIEVRKSWQPAVTADLTQRAASTSTPRFSFSDDPQVYMERAKRWMLRKGQPFGAYIQQDLREYFNASELDPNEFKKRKDAFREAFTAALGSSEPLVRLNPALLSLVHGKAIGQGTRLVFSAIPFADDSEMYEIAKSALTAAGLWDENISKNWFKDSKVDGIDVFAMSGFPFQPVVMESIMAPIARGWLADSTNEESRSAFWKWKRARLLREAVPVDPEVFDSILRGWYVAKALGQLDVDKSDADRGPRLSVWDPAQSAFVSFPHPLLYPGSVPAQDFPGAVMESLIVALPLVHAAGNLSPLAAYHVLMDLGGKRSQLSARLASWIRDGSTADGAPAPDANRAGSPSDGMETRQLAVQKFFDGELEDVRSSVIKQDTQASVYTYPVSWEIRDTIDTVLKELRDGVLELKPEISGI